VLAANASTIVTGTLISVGLQIGNARVVAQTCVKLRSGVYSSTYITPAGGPLGIWNASLDAVNATGSLNDTDRQTFTTVVQLVRLRRYPSV
jgi:hypothetical protein